MDSPEADVDPFFQRYGYKVVERAYDVVRHREGLSSLFAYVKALPDAAPDREVPSSPAYYGDIEMSKLLIRLMPLVSRETGLDLYPTYVYLRRYGPGAVLPRHRDRNACEISCTLCLGQDGDYNWPIWVQDLEGTEHEISQNSGDLVIYRGIEMDHWREPDDGRVQCQAQAFLHYVDQNGPHQNEIFDAPDRAKGIATLAAARAEMER